MGGYSAKKNVSYGYLPEDDDVMLSDLIQETAGGDSWNDESDSSLSSSYAAFEQPSMYPFSMWRGEISETPVERLIKLQNSDGSWPLTEDICKIIGVDLSTCINKLKAIGADSWGSATFELAKKLMATALVLVYLDTKQRDCLQSWITSSTSAEWFLDKDAIDNLSSRFGISSWKNCAKSILSEHPKTIADCISRNICTYSITKATYAAQQMVSCYTCNLTGNTGTCVPCSKICHAGHQIGAPINKSQFYCDCAETPNCKCLIK